MDTLTYRSLRIERYATTAEVVLMGPGKGNALGPDFWDEAPQAFKTLSDDDDVRAVIVRADGPHFTYGLDLTAMAPELAPLLVSDARTRSRFGGFAKRLEASMRAVVDCVHPVIAAINGRCIGGGVELALACDLRYCSADALISLREVKAGFVADLGGIQRLPYAVGEGLAREMALLGEDVDAQRAQAIGLVNGVFADAHALVAGARDVAERIAANPPLVVRGIKAVMNARVAAAVDAGLHAAVTLNASLVQSNDFREGLSAFSQKRAPAFKGE